jgi:pfkB family carbohydrate kinase
MSSLLIAGPLALDDFATLKGMLGGAGGYAAMAAAPLANTQLWSRGGSDFTPQVRGVLERRGIDLSGVTWDGATAHNQPAPAPILPTVEPQDAGDITAVLLIGLGGGDWQRATRVLEQLPKPEQRSVIVAPHGVSLSDPAVRAATCAAADVLILRTNEAQAATGQDDIFAAGRQLIDLGAKCVVITAGCLGGLIVYRQKATTFPALPVEISERTGVSASFAGVLAAWLTGAGKEDFRAIKRGCAVASAVAGICGQGPGPKKLLAADRKEYLERFNKLRRAAKG